MFASDFKRRLASSACATCDVTLQPLSIPRRTFVRMLAGLMLAGSGLAACNSAPAPVALSEKKLISYTGHVHPVFTAAWSLDGLSIASGGDDKTVQIWNALEGTTQATYTQTCPMTSVAWSPDGKYLAAGGDNKQVVIRNSSTGKLAWTLENSGHVWGLKWSPDGQYLAVGGDGTVYVWHQQNGLMASPLLYSGHKSFVWDLSWSPNGQYLASASGGKDKWGREDNTVQVWDAKNRNLIYPFTRHKNGVHGVDWSPDGRFIASVGYDQKIFIWEAMTGRVIFENPPDVHDDDVYGVSWSPNGRYVASCGRDRLVKIWDVQNKSLAVSYDGQAGAIFRAVWSPEGKRLAVSCRDSVAQIWELPDALVLS